MVWRIKKDDAQKFGEDEEEVMEEMDRATRAGGRHVENKRGTRQASSVKGCFMEMAFSPFCFLLGFCDVAFVDGHCNVK